MVHPVEIRLGTSYRVVEILVWPEHLVVIEIAPVEQIKGDSFETTSSSLRRSVRPTIRAVGQQSVPQRVAAVVERDDPVGHEDMVSGKPLMRSA